MEEKEFEKITVTEIVKCADINRGTFYLHFEDKYDMIASFENEMIEKIEDAIVKNLPDVPSRLLFIQTRYDTIVEILKCYEENRELLQFLLKSRYSSFQNKLRERLKLVFIKEVAPKIKEIQYEVRPDLFIILFTSISLALAEYFYLSKSPINIEQSANLLFDIVLKGPAKALGLLQDEDAK